MIKRVLYLGYYYKELDKTKFAKFVNFAREKSGKSKLRIYLEMISSSLKYNISLLEYFQFGFWKISENEKHNWAGTGFMYEYQLKMNPKSCRSKLEDKKIFLETYAPFVKRSFATISQLESDYSLTNKLLSNPSGKVVLKLSTGQVGAEVKVYNVGYFINKSLLEEMKEKNFDLVEEFVIQHPDLMKLSPTALNTVRIFTQLTRDNKVEILGARLRISVNSSVDNMAAGNLAASVDLQSGKVDQAAVYSDITKPTEVAHPITHVPIVGFCVPYWNQVLEIVTKAALHDTSNRSIGWDVAISETGPELIEGNHNWCKILWQLPVNKGLKPLLEKYL